MTDQASTATFDWSLRLNAKSQLSHWRVKVHRPGWATHQGGHIEHFATREHAEAYIEYQQQLETPAGNLDWITLDVRLHRGGARLSRWGHVWRWSDVDGEEHLDGKPGRRPAQDR